MQQTRDASEKIPIVFVTTVFDEVNTGPAMYAQYVWNAFRDDPELEFHIVAPSSTIKHERIHESGTSKKSLDLYARLQKTAIDVAMSCQRLPIVHTNNAHAVWMLRKYQGPVVAQINDYDAANVWHHPIGVIRKYGLRRFLSLVWRRRMERQALQFVSLLILNSKFTLSQIQQAYPNLKACQAKVIYKAVDVDMFSSDERQLTSCQNKLLGSKRILFVGANWQRKGLDIAIRAIALLKDQFQEIALIIAGKQSQSSDHAIRQLATELRIEAHVQFLGQVNRDDLPHLFRACDALVLPSRQEALGVAILEGLAAGLPVVASNVGGIPEILQESRFSKLVPPECPVKLANAIEQVLNNKTQAAEVWQECQEIAARFGKSLMTKNVRQMYFDIDSERN